MTEKRGSSTGSSMLNVMKRYALRILSALIIAAALIGSVSAHPGRTDSNGGHTDHSTGEYHYHHGYSAHDHYDMDGDGVIDCPYDFDDQTDHSNHGYSREEKDDEWDAVPYEDIQDRVEQYGESVTVEHKDQNFFQKHGLDFWDVVLGGGFALFMSWVYSMMFAGAIGWIWRKVCEGEKCEKGLTAIWLISLVIIFVLIFRWLFLS